jgi:hypothetical protein
VDSIRLTRGCNGPHRRFAAIAADEPQGRYTDPLVARDDAQPQGLSARKSLRVPGLRAMMSTW